MIITRLTTIHTAAVLDMEDGDMMNNKQDILKTGIEINLFEKDGFETKIGKIISCDADGIVVEYKNAMETGTLKIPFNSIKMLDVNITTKANSLDYYKL